MFGTLRYNRSSDEAYSLEATDAPFAKKRQGVPARTACASCRERKAKCTGEEYGCQRCLAKNIECRYPSTQRKRPGSTATEGTRQGTPTAARGSPDRSLDSTEEDSATTTTSFSSTLPDSQSRYSKQTDIPTDPSSGGVFPDAELGFCPDLNFPFDFQTSAGFDAACPQQIQHDGNGFASDLPSPSGEPPHGGLSSTRFPKPLPNVDGFSGSTSNRFPAPPRSREHKHNNVQGCLCFSLAMCTHEAIEVNLVHGLQDQSATAENLLQHMKTCLADCEALLRCHACRTKSEYVMLILSMCEKIACSLEDARAVLLPSDSRRNDLHSDKTDRSRVWGTGSGASWTQHPVNASEALGSGITSVSAAPPARRESVVNEVDNIHGQRDRTSWREEGEIVGCYPSVRRRLRIGFWQLDDDDETHVLRGLLVARIGKFASLLEMLRDVVGKHQWPVHKNLTWTLQGRFEDAFNTI
ncbi:hypothetical protein F5B21DRAFT_474613 [Xylaria acuta]|nr:hypothetical protein F5B21DRAFT_474613 [Xylaria acuta]